MTPKHAVTLTDERVHETGFLNMTTTAFDDQFTVGTQTVQRVQSVTDTVAILRRNVADLELALRTQTERAESYAETLRSLASYIGAGGYNSDTVDAGVFEEKIRWGIGEIMERTEAAEAELAKLAQQKPAGWMREDGNLYLAWQKDLCLPEVKFQPLYASPIPAPAAQETPMTVSLGKGEFVIWPINDWDGHRGLAFVRDANPQAVGTCHSKPESGSIELGADDMVISFGNVESAMVLAERLQYVIGQMAQVPSAPAPVPDGDDFDGDTPHMIRSIEALVDMSDRGKLTPHALCGHARKLLLASANRLRQQVAPSVLEEWREVISKLVGIVESSTKFHGCDAVVKQARALLQSAAAKESATPAPDCRTCASRGRVNGLSQETYCDGCVWYGAYWKKNHYKPLPEPAP